jgi:GT2 family glycosyltransferase
MKHSVEAISVLIPTWRRAEQLAGTIHNILSCSPRPAEVIVHIDAGDDVTEPLLSRTFGTEVKILKATRPRGPGGGRNLLIRAATQSFFASFDDDSRPLREDYFARMAELLKANPDAAVIGASIVYDRHCRDTPPGEVRCAPSFEGCGHVGRVKAFKEISGYVPLRYAYGMEEVDVSLQLLDRKWRILSAPHLSVFHDTDLSHHVSPGVNGSQIRNTALKAFLRYPIRYWPLGLLQTFKRVSYSLRNRRFKGILGGLLSIPFACFRYVEFRSTVRPETIRFYRQLSKN